MRAIKPFTRRLLGWSAVAVLVLAAAMALGGCRKRRGIRIFRQGAYVSDRRARPVVIVVDEGRHRRRDEHRARRPDKGRRRPADGPIRRR